MNAMPAAPWLPAISLIAPLTMSWAGPGPSWWMLSSSACVAESPASPRIETSTIRAGKIDRIA